MKKRELVPRGTWVNEPDLGKVPDEVLAQKHGCSATAVRVARQKRQIPAFRPRKPNQEPVATNPPAVPHLRHTHAKNGVADVTAEGMYDVLAVYEMVQEMTPMQRRILSAMLGGPIADAGPRPIIGSPLRAEKAPPVCIRGSNKVLYGEVHKLAKKMGVIRIDDVAKGLNVDRKRASNILAGAAKAGLVKRAKVGMYITP